MVVSRMIVNAVANKLGKHFKLEKIMAYVFNDNELDKMSKHHDDRIRILESIAHPPQEYICCRKCGCKITKTKEK